ncbi:hypothetical protein A2304_02375 [Candidatus Uhrbacteria bacterium RIFOXYB2_FULL_57_15]|uniref:Uncharacterized protein n=1 Tax=Candidatus Uhrbacteria bacterium RIFOXYB2_FULL_57_15 TaxID=1802422 RepID=A0A1F7W9E4_9BACT|nr:MAG: hypothetical protein A2304_02375 [Candidatus Uhrbacteria bacterium RIFOXYB2_FULL_57_15]
MEDRDLPVATSMGALVRSSDRRRETILPRRERFPEAVGHVRDKALGIDVAAAIGITGHFLGVGEYEGHTAAQWCVSIYPNVGRVAQRLARQDLRDIIDALHKGLMRTGVRPGATYEAYFSVPRGGGDNVLLISFKGKGVRFGRDPWLSSDEVFAEVQGIIEARLGIVFQHLWNSWTKDPDIAAQLGPQNIPIAASQRTQFHPDVTRKSIRDMLPIVAQRTLFMVPRDPPVKSGGDAADDWSSPGVLIAIGLLLGAIVVIAALLLTSLA